MGRPRPVQLLEVALPRFALGWRLLDEFELESYSAPSQMARQLLTDPLMAGFPDLAYQARRARCQVRDLPRLTVAPVCGEESRWPLWPGAAPES